ncbi:hypothetical protein N9139_02125 [Akkermansiaceae bacterium]|nr:hypothetical protein [Akkermansiaceae bacterium]
MNTVFKTVTHQFLDTRRDRLEGILTYRLIRIADIFWKNVKGDSRAVAR